MKNKKEEEEEAKLAWYPLMLMAETWYIEYPLANVIQQ